MTTTRIVILSLFVAVSGIMAAETQIPIKGPEHTEAKIGDEAILTCKTEYSFRFCSFVHSESETSYALDADINYVDGTVLFEGENDPDKKTCGMKITNVTENQNGEWRCLVTAIVDGKTRQGIGYANITVILKPTDISMEVNGVKGGDFKVKYPRDQDERVTCKATGGRPAPTFKWMLGDKEIEGLNEAKIDSSTDIFPDGTTDYSQTITFKAVQNHNGKAVSCIAQQEGYSVEDKDLGLNKVSKIMDVSFKPVSALNDFSFYGMVTGKEGEIKIAFLSHPRPTSVEWIMHDQGETPVLAAPTADGPITSLDGRYTAVEIEEGPTEGYYTAQLKIAEVQQKDSETHNTLIVRNELGATTYSFTIGIGNPPPSTNDLTSPWIGVIVGVLVVIIIVGLVVVVNRYHPFCPTFNPAGSATAKDDKEQGIETIKEKDGDEGSDTESVGNDDKKTAKTETEVDGASGTNVPKTKSVTDRMTSLLTAMKKTVGGRKEEDENKEEVENKKEDTIVYADLDKSALTEGKSATVDIENEKTEYAEINPPPITTE